MYICIQVQYVLSIMYVCMSACIYECARMYAYTVCIYILDLKCMYSMYVCICNVLIYIYTVCMYVYTYECMYICIYVCIYIYIGYEDLPALEEAVRNN